MKIGRISHRPTQTDTDIVSPPAALETPQLNSPDRSGI